MTDAPPLLTTPPEGPLPPLERRGLGLRARLIVMTAGLLLTVLAVFAAVALAALWDLFRRRRQVAASTAESSSASASDTVTSAPTGNLMKANTAIA